MALLAPANTETVCTCANVCAYEWKNMREKCDNTYIQNMIHDWIQKVGPQKMIKSLIKNNIIWKTEVLIGLLVEITLT